MGIDRPLRRVRRRLRLQAALDGGARAAILAAATLLVGVYLFRLGLFGRRGLLVFALAAASAFVAGVLVRAFARISVERAAHLCDRTHALSDRLRSALVFSAVAAPTPFMRAAIADAERAAAAIDVRRAAPLSRPKETGAAIAVALAASLVSLFHFSSRHAAPATNRPPVLLVDRAALVPEMAAVTAWEKDAAARGDENGRKLAAELNQLLTQIDQGELTRTQAFDKLAELENKYLRASDGALEDLKRKLRKAGSELERSKLLEKTGQALQQDDLEKAKKELEKLAAEAEKRAAEPKLDEKWDRKQREEAAKAMEAAAEQEQQREEEKRQQEEKQRLEEEQRQLKKKLAERPNDQDLKRQLERNQRQLERLEREKEARAEQKRQLERLQRELEKAAEQLRNKLSPQALKRLAEQMQRMQNEITRLGQGESATVQIAEIKEVLRRAGRSDGSQGQSGEARNQGKGMRPKGGKADERLRDFESRAGGKGNNNTFVLGENGGQGDTRLLLPLPLGQGNQPGPSGNGNELGGDRGNGIGNQHDANLLGDATSLDGKRHATSVEGQQGAGPSRSQTILGSAQKGFSSTSYKNVYRDYTAVSEEVMQKEKVPPGYRFYVKRYFQLIKPRE
jgi:hypothetical protein